MLLGSGAFGYCPSIKEFTIQQGTTEIGNNVLYYSPLLTKLVVADSVIRIGYGFVSSSYYLPCIFWAGPQGISIEGYQYSTLSRIPICATDSSTSTTGNLRPTMQPTIPTPLPTISPTVSQNPTLSPSVSITNNRLVFHAITYLI